MAKYLFNTGVLSCYNIQQLVKMNPASEIVRKVFPNFSISSERADGARRNSHCFGIGADKNQDSNPNNQEIQRLREAVFKLNMEIAACRGAKQRLEKTVQHYESMENYYLTELEVRKSRADCLESQLTLVLEEFPSHKPLRAPDRTQSCQGCEDSERIITKFAHQLNLKNQLLILLDKSYKDAMDKISACLKDSKTAEIEQTQDEDDKENICCGKSQSIETQTLADCRPLEPVETNRQEQSHPYKKSKVILKRVMPQRENSTNLDNKPDR